MGWPEAFNPAMRSSQPSKKKDGLMSGKSAKWWRKSTIPSINDSVVLQQTGDFLSRGPKADESHLFSPFGLNDMHNVNNEMQSWQYY